MGNNCPCLDIRSKHEKLWHEVMTDGYEYKVACCCGGTKPRMDVIIDLLERGAEPDYRSSRGGRNGDTMIHRAVRLRHMELLQLLMQKATQLSVVSIQFSSTPMHYAIQNNMEKYYLMLAKRGADPSVVAAGETVLSMCVLNKRYHEALRNIVQIVGMDKDKLRGLNHEGLSVLHVAIKKKRRQILDWLTSGNRVPIDLEDAEGRPPLFYAVELDHTECCKILLRNGANLAKRGPHKATSLIHASILRRSNPLKSILWDIAKTRSMARLNDVDKDGNTAVHYAVTSARGGILKLLLKAGANPNIANKKKCYVSIAAAFLVQSTKYH